MNEKRIRERIGIMTELGLRIDSLEVLVREGLVIEKDGHFKQGNRRRYYYFNNCDYVEIKG